MGGTTNLNETEGSTGLENAETRGSTRGKMEKEKHGKAFQREDEREELERKRK
jgi:hypothetical protein